MRIRIWNREKERIPPFSSWLRKKNYFAPFPRLNWKKFVVCLCECVCALRHTNGTFPLCNVEQRRKKECDGKATKQMQRGGKGRQTTVNRRLWLQVQSDYIRIYISTLIYVSASHFSSSRTLSGRRRIFFAFNFSFY